MLPIPLSSRKVTLETTVWKQDEGMSHTGYRCSGPNLYLSGCPVHSAKAHALSAPQRRDFSSHSYILQEVRSCTPNSLTDTVVVRLSEGSWDKATCMSQCSPGHLTYFLFPSVAPCGN